MNESVIKQESLDLPPYIRKIEGVDGCIYYVIYANHTKKTEIPSDLFDQLNGIAVEYPGINFERSPGQSLGYAEYMERSFEQYASIVMGAKSRSLPIFFLMLYLMMHKKKCLMFLMLKKTEKIFLKL